MSVAHATPPTKMSAITYADYTLPAGMRFTPTLSTYEISKLTLKPGGTVGWHSHDGPVLIEVTHETLVGYTAVGDKCVRLHKKAGQALAEQAGRVHTISNAGKTNLVFMAVVNHAKGTPVVIDQERPANCPR